MAGLGLSFGKQKSKSVSTSKGSGTSLTEITRFDELSKEQLDELTSLLGDRVAAPSTEFSKQSAIGDITGVVNNLFKQFSETALPQIFSQEAATGGYSSTNAQFMANDAFAETVSKAAQVTSDAIVNYEQLSQGQKQLDLQGVISALQLQAQAKETQDTAETYKSTGTSRTKGSSSGLGLSFGGG